MLAIRAMHAGEADEARRLLAPLFAAAGPPLVDGMRPMRFADASDGRHRARATWSCCDELPDAVIEALVAADEPVPTVEVRHWGGAMARPAAGAGPVGHRDVPLSVILDAHVPAVAAALAPSRDGRLVPELPRRSGPHARRPSRPPTTRRCATVKAAYDPRQPLPRRPRHRAGRRHAQP